MQILVLASFMIVLALRGASSGDGSGWLLCLVTGGYVLIALALGALRTGLFLHWSKPGFSLPVTVVKLHRLLGMAIQLWLLGGLAGLIRLGLDGWVNGELGLGRLPMVGTFALLLPFFLALILVWAADYPFHRETWWRRSSRSGWTLGQYLAYNIRHQLLFVAVPVGLIVLVADCLDLYVSDLLPGSVADYVLAGAGLASAVAILCFAPLMIVRIWKTSRLPAGELRSGLEEICRRLGLGYRDILIWQSDGVITNAAVMGFVGPMRYILLSDGLIEQMGREDVKAVFAHEAGHILYKHIPYAAMFTMGLVTMCVSAAYGIWSLLEWPEWTAGALALVILAIVWANAFGWISRRFERQSDVTGAWISGPSAEDDDPERITHEGAAVFVRALHKIGHLNGIPARRRSWRHGSLAQRISYILWLGSTGGTRGHIDTVVRRIKAMVWVVFLIGLAIGVLSALTSAGPFL